MKVAVLVSGGVDSSVALAELAAQRDLELTAFYLKIWLEDELGFLGACPWEEDLAHIRPVTEALGVPLEVIPLQRAYHERVVAHALEELRRGRTPSPDLHCNAQIKFGAFLEAVSGDFHRVATGHYAAVSHPHDATGAPLPSRLLCAADPKKDQTYFLARLSRAQLGRALFPLGGMTKGEVRARARELSLVTAERKDSQGICFLGKIPYPEFVRAHLGDAPGPIVDVDTGQRLGAHPGVWFYTIGQRRGLGLGQGPWFVVGRELATATLFVAHQSRAHLHHRRRFEVDSCHWFGEAPEGGARLEVKLRHGPRRQRCILESDEGTPEIRTVELEEPDAGIAPGQFAVFYRDVECLGSAVIR